MSNNFTENDWKLFKSKIQKWQESYMSKLISEYSELLNSNENSSEKFWELEKRINKDKKHPVVRMEMKRTTLIPTIVTLLQEDVIDCSDLDEFSDELKETVNLFIG